MFFNDSVEVWNFTGHFKWHINKYSRHKTKSDLHCRLRDSSFFHCCQRIPRAELLSHRHLHHKSSDKTLFFRIEKGKSEKKMCRKETKKRPGDEEMERERNIIKDRCSLNNVSLSKLQMCKQEKKHFIFLWDWFTRVPFCNGDKVQREIRAMTSIKVDFKLIFHETRNNFLGLISLIFFLHNKNRCNGMCYAHSLCDVCNCTPYIVFYAKLNTYEINTAEETTINLDTCKSLFQNVFRSSFNMNTFSTEMHLKLVHFKKKIEKLKPMRI